MSQAPELFSSGMSREFAMVCELDGTVTWADLRTTQLIGITSGDHVDDALASDSTSKFRTFLSHAAELRTEGWELTFICQGRPLVFECIGMPFHDGMMIVATQLPVHYTRTLEEMSSTLSQLSGLQRETQRQQRELQNLANKLEKERTLLRGIADQLPVGIRVVDAKTQLVIMTNPEAEKILGTEIDPEDELGLNMVVEYPDGRPFPPAEYPVVRTLSSGETIYNEEAKIVLSDGSRRTIQVSSAPIHDQHNEMIAAVAVYHDITTLRQLQEQLEHDNLHDWLTGLPNRRLLLDRLAQSLRISQRRGTQVALLFLDLDDFKQVNDTLGHVAGDELLITVSDRIRSVVRDSDTAARISGDEFVLLLDDVSNDTSAVAVAKRLQAAMTTPIEIMGQEMLMTFSIGIALSGNGNIDADTLLKNADQAMYTAKRGGKRRFVVRTDDMITTGTDANTDA